jgi:hypothetical protein
MFRENELKQNFDIQNFIDIFFKNSSIEVDWEFEGQRIGDRECYRYDRKDITDISGKIYIGAKAGPSCSITNLIHEMCHFVEIDDIRMREDGWGLKVPEVFIFNRMCIEPNTCQMTLRELRVWCLQYAIHHSFGISGSFRDLISSSKYLPDSSLVPFRFESRNYFTSEDKKYFYDMPIEKRNFNCDELRFNYLEWLSESYKEKYNFDFFVREWERKNKLLKE